MKAHNYNKRYIHGRYVTKATKALYDGLLVTSLVLLAGFSFHLIATHSVADAKPMVGANPYYIEIKQEDEPQEVAGKGAPISEKKQIIEYIVEVFGEHAPDAFNVLYCENRQLDPYATNHNRNGTVDRGIFQLNSAYWGGEENFDWKTNVDKARAIFDRAGEKWTPWTCATEVGQNNYLKYQ